jgi:alginate O-acetyltransferase complex protein AlgI
MKFDTTTFLLFFSAFFAVYLQFFRHYRIQNVLVIIGSCFFYGWWSRIFLLLMLVSVIINYMVGILIDRAGTPRSRKAFLALGIFVDLGILCAFKYAGFFIGSLVSGLNALGLHPGSFALDVLLPIGISFYTFQGVAYLTDVYRGNVKAERDPIIFCAFKTFFPQLVAGPIERAANLMPQFKKPRVISAQDMSEAVWLLIWGFFLKVVIANTASVLVDQSFRDTQTNGWFTILGTLAFTIQIYCDFNAYSLIARGVARLLGIQLVWNFNLPYFSTSIQEFWRRWHISLSTWLRDYLYISLGGNRKGTARTYTSLMLTMLIGGLWHGAAWNYIIWGGWHGAALAAHRWFTRNSRVKIRAPKFLGWLFTFFIVVAGWFIFRCRSLEMAHAMLTALGNMVWTPALSIVLRDLIVISVPVAIVEMLQYRANVVNACPLTGRFSFSIVAGAMLVVIYAMFDRFTYAFIYFQF